MNKRTRTLTLSALFSALAVVSLYVASVWPTGQLGLAALASLFVAAAVIESGLKRGALVFIVSSALSMLIVPNRVAPLIYILFFGYYPLVKSLIERIRSKAVQWALKLLVFNASLTIVWFLLREFIIGFDRPVPLFLIYLAGSVVFLIFDYGLSKVIWLYIGYTNKMK